MDRAGTRCADWVMDRSASSLRGLARTPPMRTKAEMTRRLWIRWGAFALAEDAPTRGSTHFLRVITRFFLFGCPNRSIL